MAAAPSLFLDEFPTVSSSEELAAVVARYPHYDRYYIASGSIPERRARFEHLWATYQPFADAHFLKQVRSNFHARTWEMYMGAVVLRQGFALESPHDSGPDIHITAPASVWLEAVTTTSGNGSDAVPEPTDGLVHTYPESQLLLRLVNCVREKLSQYGRHVHAQLVGPSEPYVIAVNSGGILHVEDPAMPLMVKCAFGIGHLVVPLSEPPEAPFRSRRESVTKRSGAEVPLGFFRDKDFAPISAVIYSSRNVLNHSDPIGADCIVIPNPMAQNPLPDGMFAPFEQWLSTEDEIRRIRRPG